ncbi:MAG: class I SAM-dependent methyltransferase [Acidimicrobiales bacterium]|jgi:O-antigen chain-terminating methyltransferase
MNLSEAEAHAQLGLPIPKGTPNRLLKRLVAKLSWFFLHHQVAYNVDVIKALNSDLGPTSLMARLESLDARLNTQSANLDTLGRDLWAAISTQTAQIDSQGADIWVAIADVWAAMAARSEAHSKELESFNRDLWTAISAQSSRHDELSRDVWGAIAKQTEQIETLAHDIWEAVHQVWKSISDAREELEEGQAALQIHVDLMQRQAFARHHEGIGSLRSGLVEMSLQFGEIHERIDAAASRMNEQLAAIRSEIEATVTESRRRQGTVDILLHEVRRSLPEPLSPQSIESLPSPMDALYAEFEEVFRGPSSAVARAVQDYLPDIVSLQCHGPVLDLGCGRGEWLEILRDAGVDAYGVDLSRDFVEHCQARGLKVSLSDACEHLKAVPERSLSAVTAFHFVEHLSIDGLLQMIDLAVRALEPGGVLILETPNPENLTVGASSFYLDPSHVRPVPPDLLVFLVEARGLAEVETRFLHPNEENKLRMPAATAAWSVDFAPLVDAVGARLFGPMDYAIIGRRL